MEHLNQAAVLSDMIHENHRPLDNEEVFKSYVRDMLKALEFVHSLGVIHADVKLENMMAHKEPGSDRATIKLCDFGLSLLTDMSQETVTMEEVCGTKGYMAPEIEPKGCEVSSAIDLWALGICIYEMATSYKPDVMDKSFRKSCKVPFWERDWKKWDSSLKDLVE